MHASNVKHIKVTSHMQLEIFHVKYATYLVKHAMLTSNMRWARIFENISFLSLLKTCNIWRQTCNNRCKICNMQYFTSNMKLTTYTRQRWHQTWDEWEYLRIFLIFGFIQDSLFFVLFKTCNIDVNHATMLQTRNNLCKTCNMQHFTLSMQPIT